jgi:mannose-6-phosphate isomerase-like protein (cupin superfamily)
VIDGSATMVAGGKLVGEARTIAKGDFIIVPEHTPHWFISINGTLVLIILHVPRPVPSAH